MITAGANGSTPAVTTESPQVHLSRSLVAPAPTPTSISPTSTTSSPSIDRSTLPLINKVIPTREVAAAIDRILAMDWDD